jgi:hypothetical protein
MTSLIRLASLSGKHFVAQHDLFRPNCVFNRLEVLLRMMWNMISIFWVTRAERVPLIRFFAVAALLSIPVGAYRSLRQIGECRPRHWVIFTSTLFFGRALTYFIPFFKWGECHFDGSDSRRAAESQSIFNSLQSSLLLPCTQAIVSIDSRSSLR